MALLSEGARNNQGNTMIQLCISDWHCWLTRATTEASMLKEIAAGDGEKEDKSTARVEKDSSNESNNVSEKDVEKKATNTQSSMMSITASMLIELDKIVGSKGVSKTDEKKETVICDKTQYNKGLETVYDNTPQETQSDLSAKAESYKVGPKFDKTPNEAEYELPEFDETPMKKSGAKDTTTVAKTTREKIPKFDETPMRESGAKVVTPAGSELIFTDSVIKEIEKREQEILSKKQQDKKLSIKEKLGIPSFDLNVTQMTPDRMSEEDVGKFIEKSKFLNPDVTKIVEPTSEKETQLVVYKNLVPTTDLVVVSDTNTSKEGGTKRPERMKMLSEIVRSPYIKRVVSLNEKRTPIENNFSNWIFCGVGSVVEIQINRRLIA